MARLAEAEAAKRALAEELGIEVDAAARGAASAGPEKVSFFIAKKFGGWRARLTVLLHVHSKHIEVRGVEAEAATRSGLSRPSGLGSQCLSEWPDTFNMRCPYMLQHVLGNLHAACADT